MTERDGLPKEAFRTRNRSVRRLTKRLYRIALRKGEQTAEELKEAYRELVAITHASCAQARRVASALRERTDARARRSEEHTSELQSRQYLVCRLLLEKKNTPRYSLP